MSMLDFVPFIRACHISTTKAQARVTRELQAYEGCFITQEGRGVKIQFPETRSVYAGIDPDGIWLTGRTDEVQAAVNTLLSEGELADVIDGPARYQTATGNFPQLQKDDLPVLIERLQAVAGDDLTIYSTRAGHKCKMRVGAIVPDIAEEQDGTFTFTINNELLIGVRGLNHSNDIVNELIEWLRWQATVVVEDLSPTDVAA